MHIVLLVILISSELKSLANNAKIRSGISWFLYQVKWELDSGGQSVLPEGRVSLSVKLMFRDLASLPSDLWGSDRVSDSETVWTLLPPAGFLLEGECLRADQQKITGIRRLVRKITGIRRFVRKIPGIRRFEHKITESVKLYVKLISYIIIMSSTISLL